MRAVVPDLEVLPLAADAHFAFDRETLFATTGADLDARVQTRRRRAHLDVSGRLGRPLVLAPVQDDGRARRARVAGGGRVADKAQGAGLEADLLDAEIRGHGTRDLGHAVPGD